MQAVETILRGTGKVACPGCRAIIDKHEQDRENESNVYFCANCGLILYKSKALREKSMRARAKRVV